MPGAAQRCCISHARSSTSRQTRLGAAQKLLQTDTSRSRTKAIVERHVQEQHKSYCRQTRTEAEQKNTYRCSTDSRWQILPGASQSSCIQTCTGAVQAFVYTSRRSTSCFRPDTSRDRKCLKMHVQDSGQYRLLYNRLAQVAQSAVEQTRPGSTVCSGTDTSR